MPTVTSFLSIPGKFYAGAIHYKYILMCMFKIALLLDSKSWLFSVLLGISLTILLLMGIEIVFNFFPLYIPRPGDPHTGISAVKNISGETPLCLCASVALDIFVEVEMQVSGQSILTGPAKLPSRKALLIYTTADSG